MNKIRSDILFLLLAKADRKLVVFTERDMYEWWNREDARGRVPGGIEFKLVEIPEDLRAKLEKAQREASREMRQAPESP